MPEVTLENVVDEISELGETLQEAISELSKKDSYDKDLNKSIQDNFDKLIKAISGSKKIDLTPVVNIASDISKQNGSIMDMVGRLIHNQDNSEMIKLVTDMVKRNNDFTAQVFKQNDYTESLKLIANNLKNEVIERAKVNYQDGKIATVDFIYKKISNGR